MTAAQWAFRLVLAPFHNTIPTKQVSTRRGCSHCTLLKTQCAFQHLQLLISQFLLRRLLFILLQNRIHKIKIIFIYNLLFFRLFGFGVFLLLLLCHQKLLALLLLQLCRSLNTLSSCQIALDQQLKYNQNAQYLIAYSLLVESQLASKNLFTSIRHQSSGSLFLSLFCPKCYLHIGYLSIAWRNYSKHQKSKRWLNGRVEHSSQQSLGFETNAALKIQAYVVAMIVLVYRYLNAVAVVVELDLFFLIQLLLGYRCKAIQLE